MGSYNEGISGVVDELQCLKLLNTKRHDWLNHIQVIMGYVSLNDMKRLRSYLEKILEEIKCESKISHLGYPPLSYYLLASHLEQDKLVWHVEIEDGLRISEQQGERILKALQHIETHLSVSYPGRRMHPLRISLTLSSMHVHGLMVNVTWSTDVEPLRVTDWSTLHNRVAAWGGQIIYDERTTPFELAIRMPFSEES